MSLTPYLGTVLPEDLEPAWLGPHPWNGGVQALWRFPNGYGASVILGFGTYGVELAPLRFRSEDLHDYTLTDDVLADDVLGHLTPTSLVDALRVLRDAPPAQRQLGSGA